MNTEHQENEVHLMLGQAAAEIEEAKVQGRKLDLAALAKRYPKIDTELRSIASTIEALCDVGKTQNTLVGIPEPALKQLGDFRLIRELGRGGMGIVYEAEQISLDRSVALKVLPFASLLDERQLRRFRTEARAAAMLKHPNIVSVYSILLDLVSSSWQLANLCSRQMKRES